MAAAAYDSAALHFRGHAAKLNFPELVDHLPKPASSCPEDIRLAAQQAALRVETTNSSNHLTASTSQVDVAPITVGLSPSQIQAINDFPMDSPTMWSTEEPIFTYEMSDYEEMDDCLWD
ncbi:hypothetical protein FXO38_17253 [Capsicum annuum]|nr:hypothetical protein FXO38_17253 [Capsicum annuum]